MSTVSTSSKLSQLKQNYIESSTLRSILKIKGSPGENLFENGQCWDSDFDHELLVVADGLGAATLLLMDQGLLAHSKKFSSEDDALRTAMLLHDTAQGETEDGAPTLTIDNVEWDAR